MTNDDGISNSSQPIGWRSVLGISSEPAVGEPPRPSRYPVAALAGLAAADGLTGALLPALAPDISATLGISQVLLSIVAVATGLCASVAGLCLAAVALRTTNRAAMSRWAAAVAAAATLATAYVTKPSGMLAAQLLGLGFARGAVLALHRPLLVDCVRPGQRVRMLCWYRTATITGSVLLPAALLTGIDGAGRSWRAIFLVGGCITVLSALLAGRLTDPGPGSVEDAALAGWLDGPSPPAPSRQNMSFFEGVRRVLVTPTFRRLLIGWGALGALAFPLGPYVGFLLKEQFDMNAGGRFAVVATGTGAAVAALVLVRRRGDALLAEDPARFTRLLSGLLVGMAGALAAVAATPFVAVAVVGSMLLTVGLALAFVVFDTLTMSLVEPRLRVIASSLSGLFLVGVGTVTGIVLLGGVDRRFGGRWAVASLVLPVLLGALLSRRMATGIAEDLALLTQREIDRAELRTSLQRGVSLPLLSCHGIDFAYGPLQVLFDVGFTVDDGERVALLGTNGAGKSTLLRVISGLGVPRRGMVRYQGEDITFLDAERRVARGLTQIAGGQAVFGPLTVVENLRVYGSALGRSRRRIDDGIDVVFDVFTRLGERRNQPAATLSGGEQQMLALGKALLLNPRLLLIDELSLGLAPVVVSELLKLVERISAAGTAVVLVEQSVNVALSVVDHAYFMEKGEIRFDGSAADLVNRPDLLRSVFLEGATAAPANDLPV